MKTSDLLGILGLNRDSGAMDAPPELDEVNHYIGDHYERAVGDTLDASTDLKTDFEQRGPFWQFLEASRNECKTALADLWTVDTTDEKKTIALVRSIQQAWTTYISALGFAQKLRDSYSPPVTDSADEAEPGVGEP